MSDKAKVRELFLFVASKMLEQGHPSTSMAGECLYFSGNGDRCAFGHLLNRDVVEGADAFFEGSGAQSLCYDLNNDNVKGYLVPEAEGIPIYWFGVLQQLHDHAAECVRLDGTWCSDYPDSDCDIHITIPGAKTVVNPGTWRERWTVESIDEILDALIPE